MILFTPILVAKIFWFINWVIHHHHYEMAMFNLSDFLAMTRVDLQITQQHVKSNISLLAMQTI